ncbi:putative WRKY transcription factor 4 [Canna indica]|uniref:WRKY transcription factor 4 n=1 Tax=Canna indica TaxID=4628 RepID=A0AAQ3JSG1_9LILI|nr:putative WRKY transcription factor 4 [Canna indica]
MKTEGEAPVDPAEEKLRGDGDGGAPPPSTDSERPPSADIGPQTASEAKEECSGSSPADKSDGRSFSQLLAGAMASPSGSHRPPPILTVPVVAVPCLLTPAALIDSPSFTGQFAMTHQAVLAAVTAQAQMQMQAAYPPKAETIINSFSMLPTVSPVPLQQMSPVAEAYSDDVYHWRKYGQKQVKNTDNSRSYYRCAVSNCLAKKKVERSPDGNICAVNYSGKHNHDPPQKYRHTRDRGAQSAGPSGENESSEHPSNEPSESDPSASKAENNSGNDPPEQQFYCSSDCEGDAGIATKKDISEEPEPKRRLNEGSKSTSSPIPKTVREYIVQTEIDARHLSDGYKWRKYGQKMVKGNPNPRSYYRCTHDGCPVRKHVEKASHDAKALLITYEGKHNHDQPLPKYSSDQSASDAPASATDKEVNTSSCLYSSDQPATDAPASATDKEIITSSSLLDKSTSRDLHPTDAVKESSGDKLSEFGGDKAPEAAHSVTIKEGDDRTNSEGTINTLLDKNPAAVSVENT